MYKLSVSVIKNQYRSITNRESLFYLVTILDPGYKDWYFDQATKREVTERLRAKVSCPSENVEEPKVKKTQADCGNVSLLAIYEEILQENYVIKELTQGQTEGHVIKIYFLNKALNVS